MAAIEASKNWGAQSDAVPDGWRRRLLCQFGLKGQIGMEHMVCAMFIRGVGNALGHDLAQAVSHNTAYGLISLQSSFVNRETPQAGWPARVKLAMAGRHVQVNARTCNKILVAPPFTRNRLKVPAVSEGGPGVVVFFMLLPAACVRSVDD